MGYVFIIDITLHKKWKTMAHREKKCKTAVKKKRKRIIDSGLLPTNEAYKPIENSHGSSEYPGTKQRVPGKKYIVFARVLYSQICTDSNITMSNINGNKEISQFLIRKQSVFINRTVSVEISYLIKQFIFSRN